MKNRPYDYLIVGSGLYGVVFAHILKKYGKHCLVIDKRNHVGGNIHCKSVEGIHVHQYGPHIFHTNKQEVWDFVSGLVEFHPFIYSPMAHYKGCLFNLPFNMHTFYQLWGVTTPTEAREQIARQTEHFGVKNPQNLEEQALSLIGPDLYHRLVKGYTEKQWGRVATDVPAFIIRRIPLRYTFDNNYFTDRYQGIPVGGYNVLIDRLLEGIEVRLRTNFLDDRNYFESLADKILFTGPIDIFYHYAFGKLDYRSLRFEEELLETDNFQGNATINFTEKQVPYTRIVEHKHFEGLQTPGTVITREYPENFTGTNEPYYPINDEANKRIYEKYKARSERQRKYLFGGRLADYQYYNMDDTIEAAMSRAYGLLKKSKG